LDIATRKVCSTNWIFSATSTIIGLSTTYTSTPVRRGKYNVLTVEKAIAVIEANKNKRKKSDWKKN
jgi:hypothetical protein